MESFVSNNPILFFDFIFLFISIIAAAIIISMTSSSDDPEVLKHRFAQVLFSGMTIVFLFTAVLYYGSSKDFQDAGKDIFEKAYSVMAPLIGVVIGYFFASSKQK